MAATTAELDAKLRRRMQKCEGEQALPPSPAGQKVWNEAMAQAVSQQRRARLSKGGESAASTPPSSARGKADTDMQGEKAHTSNSQEASPKAMAADRHARKGQQASLEKRREARCSQSIDAHPKPRPRISIIASTLIVLSAVALLLIHRRDVSAPSRAAWESSQTADKEGNAKPSGAGETSQGNLTARAPHGQAASALSKKKPESSIEATNREASPQPKSHSTRNVSAAEPAQNRTSGAVPRPSEEAHKRPTGNRGSSKRDKSAASKRTSTTTMTPTTTTTTPAEMAAANSGVSDDPPGRYPPAPLGPEVAQMLEESPLSGFVSKVFVRVETHHEAVFMDPRTSRDITEEWSSFLRGFPGVNQVYRLGKLCLRSFSSDGRPALVKGAVALGNDGDRAWPASAQLQLALGSDMAVHNIPIGRVVAPGSYVNLTMYLQVPLARAAFLQGSALREKRPGERSALSIWSLSVDGLSFGPLLALEVQLPPEPFTGDRQVSNRALSARVMRDVGLELRHEALRLERNSSRDVTEEWMADLVNMELEQAYVLGRIIVEQAKLRAGFAPVSVYLQLLNSGQQAWSADATIRLASGHALGVEALPIGTEVPPGSYANILMEMQIPAAKAVQPGINDSIWVLESSGRSFGPVLILELARH